MSDRTTALPKPDTAPRRPDPVAVRARRGVFGVFWLCGVICALWSAALPSVNARLGLGEAKLGSVLLLTGIGAMIAMPVAGRLCDRWTSRSTTRVAATAAAVALVGPSIVPSYPLLLGTVFVFGASLGVLDVAMNVQAVEVEQRYHRPILSAFHGTWSLGGVVGGAVIAAGLRTGADIRVTMAGGALVSAVLFLAPGRMLLAGPGSASAVRADAVRTVVTVRRALVLLLGFIALAAYICEGAATDWAALHASRILHADAAEAPLAYTIFAATMTVVRLGGDHVHNRLGPLWTLRIAGLTTTAGYALVLLAPLLPVGALPAGYVGWALVGLGIATVVPIVFGTVGANQEVSGRSLSLVTTFGYAGLLGGPAVIGPLAGATSLGAAMFLPAVLALFITVAGPIAVRMTKPASPA